MTVAIFHAAGMTCDHCVRAVRDEVGKVQGVREVDVDLTSGEVFVRSDEPVDESAVRSAIEEAGFEVTL
jgi:copper chaperone